MRRSLTEQAPPGYILWLDEHLARFDPVVRSPYRRDIVARPGQIRPSLKCQKDVCMHYIYGFPTEMELEDHIHAEMPLRSVPIPSLETVPSRASVPNTSTIQRPTPPVQPQRPSVNTSLPPLPLPTPSTGRSDSGQSFSFPDIRPEVVGPHPDTGAKTQLPPLTGEGASRGRLKSIGELNLFQHPAPCLQCSITKRSVHCSLISSLIFQYLQLLSVIQISLVDLAQTNPILIAAFAGPPQRAFEGL